MCRFICVNYDLLLLLVVCFRAPELQSQNNLRKAFSIFVTCQHPSVCSYVCLPEWKFLLALDAFLRHLYGINAQKCIDTYHVLANRANIPGGFWRDLRIFDMFAT
jgi:hypothetical protein